MGTDDMKARIAELEAENARLKAKGRDAQGVTRSISLKVGAKGGVSLYGLGRFPVTLYQEQWTRLLDNADTIRAFIADNAGALKVKILKGWPGAKSFCKCGHTGDGRGGDHAGEGHGVCTVPGCDCSRFTWREFLPSFAYAIGGVS